MLISAEVIDFPGVAEPVFLSMFTDITERKLAEASVRLRGAALEAAANAVVIIRKHLRWRCRGPGAARKSSNSY